MLAEPATIIEFVHGESSILKQIINAPSKYNSEFFSSKPVELKDCQRYFSSIKKLFYELKKQFPLLRICMLPSYKPKTVFVQGILLPTYAIEEKYLDDDQYEQFGLPIFAHIPENYQEIGIEVYDSCQRINWENIPIEYRHCIPLNVNSKQTVRICTHHLDYVNKNNCFFPILKSAYYLFEEYRKYEKTGKFDLKCLPHSLSKDDKFKK